MNKATRVLSCTLALTLACAYGQTRKIAGTNQAISGSTFDYTAAQATSPVTTGTSLPGTCSVGQLYFKSDAAAGSNVYGCTSANTWTLMSGAGGSGGTGDVVGPGGATGGNFAQFSGSTGKLLSDSALSVNSVSSHIVSTANPHSTTKAQVGLGNVPNVDATQRTNHSGTQLSTTISDFSTAVLAACSGGACGTGGSGTGNANSFTIAKTTSTATLSCAASSTCAVQQGDSSYTYNNFIGSFTAAGGSYTAYFCANGDTMELAYNGTTITTYSGVTLIPGAVKCQPNRLLVATATVNGTTVSAVNLIDPHYIQPKTFSFPGQTVTDDGKQVTVTIAGGGGGTGVSQNCYRVNYNQASLAAGTTRVALSTGLSLPANTVVLGSWIKSNTAFTGVSGAGVSMGNSVSDTAFANVYDLTTSVSATNLQAETGFAANTSASNTVNLVFTGGANLSGLSAGQVDACILYQTISAETSPSVL